jgi:hypothetical protein
VSEQPPRHGLEDEVVGPGPGRALHGLGRIGGDRDEHGNPLVLPAPGVAKRCEVLRLEHLVLDEQQLGAHVGHRPACLAEIGRLGDREALRAEGRPGARTEVLAGRDDQDEGGPGSGRSLFHSKGFVGLRGDGL